MNTNAVVSALSIFEYIMSIHLYLTKDAKDERKQGIVEKGQWCCWFSIFKPLKKNFKSINVFVLKVCVYYTCIGNVNIGNP